MMTHHISSAPGLEFEGWPGVFRPLQHYVPSGARRLLLTDGWLVIFAVCGSPCTPPTGASTGRAWCPDCREQLDIRHSKEEP